jgi:hypothetical protein
VVAGGSHTCALVDRAAWCWGENSDGEVGIPPSTSVTVPAQVLDDVDAIDAGANHTCAVRGDGHVWCWGLNDHGELGDGSTGSHAPREIPDLTATGIALGYQHSCAIVAGGSYACWGTNASGQLGDNTSVARSTPDRHRVPIAARDDQRGRPASVARGA